MFLSISITTYNRWKLSEYCIRTIRERTPRTNHELIVIDNGSKADVVEMLKSYKAEGYIDKLVLNHRNNLASAINDAWGMASPKADWLYPVSNDVFVMEGWFENLNRVINSELKPDLVYISLRMSIFWMKNQFKTTNGGIYVKDATKDFCTVRGGVVIPKALVEKHKLYFHDEGFFSPWGVKARKKNRMAQVSIYSLFNQRVDNLRLKWVELGKPCALWQDCEFANPRYTKYYERVFGLRRAMRKFHRLKKCGGYTRYPERYYEGSDYEIGKHWRKVLDSEEGKSYWSKLGYRADYEQFLKSKAARRSG